MSGSGDSPTNRFYGTLPINPSFDGSFTIEFDVRTTNSSNDPAIMGNKDWNSGGNSGIVIVQKNGEIRVNITDEYGGTGRTDPTTSGRNIADGNWHKISVVYDKINGKVNLYDGGVLVASTNYTAKKSIAPSQPKFNIGQDGTGTYKDGSFEGNIKEIRIFNEAVNPFTIINYAYKDYDTSHPYKDNLLLYVPLKGTDLTCLNKNKEATEESVVLTGTPVTENVNLETSFFGTAKYLIDDAEGSYKKDWWEWGVVVNYVQDPVNSDNKVLSMLRGSGEDVKYSAAALSGVNINRDDHKNGGYRYAHLRIYKEQAGTSILKLEGNGISKEVPLEVPAGQWTDFCIDLAAENFPTGIYTILILMPATNNNDEITTYVDDIYFSNTPYTNMSTIQAGENGNFILDLSGNPTLAGTSAQGVDSSTPGILDMKHGFSATWTINVPQDGIYVVRSRYVSPHNGDREFIISAQGMDQTCQFEERWGYVDGDSRDKHALIYLKEGTYPVTFTTFFYSTDSRYCNLNQMELVPYTNITETDGMINASASTAITGVGIDVSGTPANIGSWSNGKSPVFWGIETETAGTFNFIGDYSTDWADVNRFIINGVTMKDFAITGNWDNYTQYYMGEFSLNEGAQILKVKRDPEAVNVRNFMFFRQEVAQNEDKNVELPVERAKIGTNTLTATTQSPDYILNWVTETLEFNVNFTEAGYFSIASTDYPGELTFSINGISAVNGEVAVPATGTFPVVFTRNEDTATNVSEFKLNYSSTPTSIDKTIAKATLISTQYYNLQGIEVISPSSGIYILRKTYDNGMVTTEKIFRK